MAQPDGLDEKGQQGWRSRFEKKRAELSNSVEEALADKTLAEDLLSDELDEVDEYIQRKVIIPPLLSLQSKPIPVVRVEPKEATNVAVIDTRSSTTSVEIPQAVQKKQRLAGRTTKVRLQAVPKSEKKAGGKVAVEISKSEEGTSDGPQGDVKNSAKRSPTHEVDVLIEGQLRSTKRGALAGTGVLKRGQMEVTIANPHISPTSVVVVTLIDDPGPVVVKYVSLQPHVGFTVHLSAPAGTKAQFNYVVLLGELF